MRVRMVTMHTFTRCNPPTITGLRAMLDAGWRHLGEKVGQVHAANAAAASELT